MAGDPEKAGGHTLIAFLADKHAPLNPMIKDQVAVNVARSPGHGRPGSADRAGVIERTAVFTGDRYFPALWDRDRQPAAAVAVEVEPAVG